jgi:hypothetical protein
MSMPRLRDSSTGLATEAATDAVEQIDAKEGGRRGYGFSPLAVVEADAVLGVDWFCM